MRWEELERRFKELESLLQSSRVDGQTGAAGEFWRIAGAPSREAADRFSAIAALAGTKLLAALGDAAGEYPEISDESDPAIRWYKALKVIGDRWEDPNHGRVFDDDGKSIGLILTGTIYQPAAASTTLCLHLSSSFPDSTPEKKGGGSWVSWTVKAVVTAALAVIGTIVAKSISG